MMKQGISLRAMAEDANEVVIDIVGVIGWDVGFAQLREIIGGLPDGIERVVFDIYSPGGDVWDGNAMIHEIGNIKAETVAKVRVAASMATLIAVACDRREMASNGRWLVHNPWTMAVGDADELEKRAVELREAEKEAAEFYAQRTGTDVDAILALMEEEVWIRADRAQELGFVHDIIDPFNVAAFAAVREEMMSAGKWPQALGEMPADEECGDVVLAQDGEVEELPADESPVQEQEAEDGEEASDDNTAEDGAGVDEEPVEDGEQPAADEPGGCDGDGEGGSVEEQEEAEQDGIVEALARRDQLIREEQAKRDRAETASRKLREELDAIRESHATALVELEKKHAEELAKLRAETEQVANEMADGYEAKLKEQKEALDVVSGRLNKLLAGGMGFCPEHGSWEEALAAVGDYAEARRRYPGLFAQYREQQKARRG